MSNATLEQGTDELSKLRQLAAAQAAELARVQAEASAALDLGKLFMGETCDARTFEKSGNVGFGWYGKKIINGSRYQVSLNIVKLKPK